MFRNFILFVLPACFACLSCRSQPLATSTNYKDILIHKNVVWALTAEGTLKIIDVASNTPATDVPGISGIDCFSQSTKGEIIIACADKNIKQYNDKKQTWATIAHYSDQISAVLCNSKNACFTIGVNGITNLKTKQSYFPDTSFSLNAQIRHRNHNMSGATACLMDKHDNIWLGYSHGEWGGELFVFNSISGTFVKPQLGGLRIDLFPVKSFFEDAHDVYLSAGLEHMFTTGYIGHFVNFVESKVLFSDVHGVPDTVDMIIKSKNMGKGERLVGGEYIGPATFNKTDGCIYFYSQHGIFKGNPKTDLSKIESWTNIAQPKFTWTYGQPDAVGASMNVLKMMFTDDGKLVVLTQKNGIGVYDGKNLVMH